MFSLETVFKEIEWLEKIIYKLDECYQALKNSSVVQDWNRLGSWYDRLPKLRAYVDRLELFHYLMLAVLAALSFVTLLVAVSASNNLSSITLQGVGFISLMLLLYILANREALKAYDRLQASSSYRKPGV